MKTADFLQYGEQGVVKPSQACSSMRTATWFSSVLCCVTWITVLNDIILVQAKSGPAMPILQVSWPCSLCWKTERGCLAKAALLLPVFVVPSLKSAWVPAGGTTFCSLKTPSALQGRYIQSRFLNLVQFFLREALIEIFLDCMFESQLSYLSIVSYTGSFPSLFTSHGEGTWRQRNRFCAYVLFKQCWN